MFQNGKVVVEIIAPGAETRRSVETAEAAPEMFKAFWPDIKGNYFFRNRRVFLDFMRTSGGRIFFIPAGPRPNPPFILVGNWRSHTDITALWHVKGEGFLKRELVRAGVIASFESGSNAFVTKPLGQFEAEEYVKWGFEPAYRITLLEKRLPRRPAGFPARDGVEVVRYRRRHMDDVLNVDATAFDEFWKLDARTMEAVATTCYHNAFLLARRGDEVLGYAVGGANGRFGYLQRLGVLASHQGEGVGELLARCLISTLQNLGAASVMVNTQDDNAPALGLYGKLGFETMPDPRVIMRCTPRSLERAR